ncbi:amidohydrolase [Ruania rhizosphaerae]|uniref:amidohydrolase n=1 Tax=Ruania rhizosphaerae TaxID=1840413 RepID=UPI0013587853|nr:amidohydrolase family protein [Ruania rhizosphaerae]
MLLRGGRAGLGGAPSDVLVRDGQIAAIGPAGSLDPDGADVVVLSDATVLPGLVDGHVHVEQLAHHSRRIDVSGSATASAVIDRLHGHVPAVGGFLVGHGFVDALWDLPPHKSMLDDRLPGVPVAVISLDLHTVWASSAALERWGLDHETGLLLEGEAMDAMARLQRSVPPTEVDRWVAEVVTRMAARGVTALIDFEYADNLTAWQQRAIPPLRVHAAVWPEWLEDAIADRATTGDLLPGTGARVHVGPFKIIADGSLNTRTAWCFAPYAGGTGPALHGLPLTDPAALTGLMGKAWAAGLTPAVHAIGDRANAMVLDAFEEVGCAGRVEHAQLVAPEDFARFARPGLIASVQPQHAVADRDVADRHWAGRTDRAFAYRALHDAGATLAFGSDAPVSTPDPWHAIADAVSRTDDDRLPWHPEQALPLDVAIVAACGGRAAFATGDLADLTVVAGDLSDPDTVRDTEVLLTLVGGKHTP